MDVLGDVLTSMQVESALFAHLRFSAPRGVAFRTQQDARLIVVASGGGRLVAERFGEPVWIEKGDCLIIKADAAFTIVSQCGTQLAPCEKVLSEITGLTHEYGGGGDVTELISGRFRLTPTLPNPFSLLPEISLVKLAAPHDQLLQTTLELFGLETKSDGMGAGVVVGHLINALFVQALRAWFAAEAGNTTVSWLTGLRDARLARALTALHADLAFPWTIAKLAREAGVSRSSFAAKFKTTLGETPLDYLTRWRIYRAKLLLKQGVSMLEVAERIGYKTDAALNRAFKRKVGIGPGAWRRANSSARPTSAPRRVDIARDGSTIGPGAPPRINTGKEIVD